MELTIWSPGYLLTTFAVILATLGAMAEEVQINTQLPIAVVSERFLSISVDPKDLMENLPLSESSVEMARALAPLFVQIAGHSTQTLVESDTATNLSERAWRSVGAWSEKSGAAIVVALPAGLRVGGVWDSTPALAILANAHTARAPLLFQLGYDASELGDGAEAGRDLARLRQIVDSFSGYRGAPVLPPGLHTRDSHFLKRLLKAAPNAVPILPIHLNFTGMNAEAASEEMAAAMSSLEEALSGIEPLSLSSSKRPIWIGDTSRSSGKWKDATSLISHLGSAARLGARVYLRHSSSSSLSRPTPEFWAAAIYRSIVGRRVLETRLEPPRPGLKLFSHCARSDQSAHSLLDPTWHYENGALTIFGVNSGSRSALLNLRAISVRDEPVHLYLLTHANGKEVLFNGERLNLSPDGRLPVVSPEIRTSSKGLTIPAGAIFFAVFPETRPLACAPGAPIAPASLTAPVRNLARTLIPTRRTQTHSQAPRPERYVSYERRVHSDIHPVERLDLSSRVMREFGKTVSRLALLASPEESTRARRHTAFSALRNSPINLFRDSEPVDSILRTRRSLSSNGVEAAGTHTRVLHVAEKETASGRQHLNRKRRDALAASESEQSEQIHPGHDEDTGRKLTGDFLKDVGVIKVDVKDPESSLRKKRETQDGSMLFPSMPFENSDSKLYNSDSEPPYSQAEVPYTLDEIPVSEPEMPYYSHDLSTNVPSGIHMEDYTGSSESNRRETRQQPEDVAVSPKEREAIRQFVSRAEELRERRRLLPEEISEDSTVEEEPEDPPVEEAKKSPWASTGIPSLDEWLAANAVPPANLADLPSLDDIMAQPMELATLDQFGSLPSINLPREVMSLEELMSRNAKAIEALEGVLNAQTVSLVPSAGTDGSTNKRQAQQNGLLDFTMPTMPTLPQILQEKRARINEMQEQLGQIQEMMRETMTNMGPNLDYSATPIAPKELMDTVTSFMNSFYSPFTPRKRRSVVENQSGESIEPDEKVKRRVRRQLFNPNNFNSWSEYPSGDLVSRFPRGDNLNPNAPLYGPDCMRIEGLLNQLLGLVSGQRTVDILARKKRSTQENHIPPANPLPPLDILREQVAAANKGADLKTLAEEYSRAKRNGTDDVEMSEADKNKEDDDEWLIGAERISPTIETSRKNKKKGKNHNEDPEKGMISYLAARLSQILSLLQALIDN